MIEQINEVQKRGELSKNKPLTLDKLLTGLQNKGWLNPAKRGNTGT